MRLYLTGSNDPYYNLAAEEYYLRESAEDVFLLWQNAPVVVIGKNQNLYAEVRTDVAEKEGIRIARRITGGGAVYHDMGNVNYTFITSREKAHVLDFATFTAPVLAALRTLGVSASLSGRNDLIAEVPKKTLEDPGFAKFSGNASTATADRILSHGTLLFDSDLSVLERVLSPDREKLRKKAIKSVKSRVTNLRPLLSEDMDTPAFFDTLVRFIESEYACEAEIADRLSVLSTGFYDRNRSADYIAGRRNSSDEERRHRFDSGLVVVLWKEENGLMRDVRIEGDFFGEEPAEMLETLLLGTRPEEDAVAAALSQTDVQRFISGVSTAEFAGLFS